MFPMSERAKWLQNTTRTGLCLLCTLHTTAHLGIGMAGIKYKRDPPCAAALTRLQGPTTLHKRLIPVPDPANLPVQYTTAAARTIPTQHSPRPSRASPSMTIPAAALIWCRTPPRAKYGSNHPVLRHAVVHPVLTIRRQLWLTNYPAHPSAVQGVSRTH